MNKAEARGRGDVGDGGGGGGSGLEKCGESKAAKMKKCETKTGVIYKDLCA